jgi:hypothetical protein
VGWIRFYRASAVLVVAMLCVACADSSAADSPASDSPSPTAPQGALPLVLSGAVLHSGNYCHFLQAASPGNNTLPVVNGCIFDLSSPVDLFATDGENYSVSQVVGYAELGITGPADSRVMVVCRLSPRVQYWFWITADAHWNISSAEDVHHPQDLVSAQDAEPLRQYLKTGGVRNQVQFKCAGGQSSNQVVLAMNVNGHQFAALMVAMPSPGTPLAKPATPWFVDLGARMTGSGSLEAVVAKVTLYDHE